MRDVSLSAADSAALQAIASSYVREAIQQAHLFHRGLAGPTSTADAPHWKRSGRHRTLTLYRERLPAPTTDSSTSCLPYNLRKVGTRLFSDPALFPASLVLGTVQGDLDDVMFGLLTPSREALALQHSHLRAPTAGPIEERLLASVVSPSFHDPLRSLALHWRGPSRRRRHLSQYSRQDDGAVLVRSTGVALLPDGERVGYELVHSVALALAGATRDPKHALTAPKLSYCSVYRQRSPGAVEVFSLGAATPRAGERLAALGADGGAKKMRALPRLEALGRAKKLSWLLATTGEPATLTASTRAHLRPSRSGCAVCFSPFAVGSSRLGQRLARLRGGRRVGSDCSVCGDSVCGRCLVTRRLRSVRWGADRGDRDPVVAVRAVPFCVRCVQRSEATGAATVAAHATLDADGSARCDLLGDTDLASYGWSEEEALTPSSSSLKSSTKSSPASNLTFFCIDDDDQVEEIPGCNPQDDPEDEDDAVGHGVSQRTWQRRWQRILTDDEAPVAVSDVDDGDLWTLESLDVAMLGDDAFQI